MPDELPFIIVALAAATALSFILTPVASRIATRTGAIDRPDAGRRIHRLPIPRAGGLGVIAAFIIVGVGALWINGRTDSIPTGRVGTDQVAALFLGAVLGAAFGFVDDRWQIRARWQFMSQLVLAGVAIAGGVLIYRLDNPIDFLGGPFSEDTLVFAQPVAIVFTSIWIVGMINSLNFIDGLDGLSTGVALIAVLTLGVLSMSQNQLIVALLCAVLAGSLAGFLPWNFHPARIFIGTTGVVAVGYALAVLSILGTAKVAVALLVLGVPIIDTFWIIIRRLANRQSPFTPDRGHFHHRLLDMGLTHRSAVLVIYLICVSLAFASLILSGAGPLYAFMGILVGGGLVLFLLTRRARDALDARSYPGDDAPDPSDGSAAAGGAARGPADLTRDDGRRHETRPAG